MFNPFVSRDKAKAQKHDHDLTSSASKSNHDNDGKDDSHVSLPISSSHSGDVETQRITTQENCVHRAVHDLHDETKMHINSTPKTKMSSTKTLSQHRIERAKLHAWMNRNNIIEALIGATGIGAEFAINTNTHFSECRSPSVPPKNTNNKGHATQLWTTKLSPSKLSMTKDQSTVYLESVAIIKLSRTLKMNDVNSPSIRLHVGLSCLDDAPEFIEVMHSRTKDGR